MRASPRLALVQEEGKRTERQDTLELDLDTEASDDTSVRSPVCRANNQKGSIRALDFKAGLE